MKIFADCLPCMLRQVLEATYMVTEDEKVHEQIMDDVLEILARYRDYKCSPELCGAVHAVVKKHTGNKDPYAAIKEKDISEALKLEPVLTEFVEKGDDQLLRALKVSATGNIMDSALYSGLDIEACIADELEMDFVISHIKEFKRDLKKAKEILIIGDNAGEVVFDKPLAKYLAKDHQLTFAVRGQPIINDVTMEDAMKTGIQEYVRLISSGSSMPGAVIEVCNDSFQEIFERADLVISKGQGNFEALSDSTRSIYFLLKAKCRRVAQALDVDINEYVFKAISRPRD